MIFWPCCCDKDCSCIGCATLDITGIDSGDYLCDQVVQEAYNRTVIMWGHSNSVETPFDLLADPTDCGENYTSYPGTKCKGESYACCQANYSDEPIDPIPLGSGYEVPGTEPGTDCFPAIVCASGTSVCTTKLTKPTHPTHHYYVDKNGYVWLAIVSYEYDVDIDGLQPHIVIIYKSDNPINCSTINSAGGSGSTIPLSQVCQGLAAESSQCSVETTPLISVAGAIITLKIYNNVTYCCDLAVDPCNDDSGFCAGDVPCASCLNGIASYNYLIEVEGIIGGIGEECCNVINASYVVTPHEWKSCTWEGCFSINPCGFDNIFITMSMGKDVNNIERIGVSAVLKQSCSDLAGSCVFGTYSVAFTANETCKNLNRKRLELDPFWTASCFPAYYGCDFSVASVYVTTI